MANCVNALKEWTGKARATVIFDSTVDEFTDGCMFEKVKGKPNVAIVATTTDGDVFGGFYSVAVTKQIKTSGTRACSSSRSSRTGGARRRSGLV